MSQLTDIQKLYKKYTNLQGKYLELTEENAELESEINDAILVSKKNKEIHAKINFLEQKQHKELEELKKKHNALVEEHIATKQKLQALKEKKMEKKRKREQLKKVKQEHDLKRSKTIK